MDQVAELMSITGADHATASNLLEAANGDVGTAVELFFASQVPDAQNDEQLARQLAAQNAPAAVPEAEVVRAPIPVKRERLYGDDSMMPRGHNGRAGAPGPQHVDAFRDFRAEERGSGLGGPSGEGGSGRGGPSSQTLASLFQPPQDLMFVGSFEDAKAAALGKGQWLLVNVQSNDEFASHMLNRDTWGHDAVRSLVMNSFTFFQVFGISPQGEKVVAFYKLLELPTIMVVDPVTGAALRTWTGFVQPERLLEELVPFMDHGPTDAGAGQLSLQHHKRQRSEGAARLAAAAAAASNGTGGDGAGAAGAGGIGIGRAGPSEEEQLAMAIAMSMQEGAASGGGIPGRQRSPRRSYRAPARQPRGGFGYADSSGEEEDDDVDFDEAEEDENDDADLLDASDSGEGGPSESEPAEPAHKVLKQSPEEVAAAAAASLPSEPAAGDPGACRIALRLPDGSRAQRRFPRSAALSALRNLVLTLAPEAAAGRPFALTMPVPGAPELSSLDQTLEEAGVADSMLVVKWV